MKPHEIKDLYNYYLHYYNTDMVTKFSLMEFISVLYKELEEMKKK